MPQEYLDGLDMAARTDTWRKRLDEPAAHAGLADLGHGEAVLWVVPGNARARRFRYARSLT